MFYIGVYRENLKKILSETTRPRALIFGKQHHLVGLYQFFFQNIAPGTKNGPAWGSNVLHRLILGKYEKDIFV